MRISKDLNIRGITFEKNMKLIFVGVIDDNEYKCNFRYRLLVLE